MGHLIRNHGQRITLGLLMGSMLLMGSGAFAAQLPDETATTIFSAHVREQVSISLPSELAYGPESIQSAQSQDVAYTNDMNEVRILVGMTDSMDRGTFTKVGVSPSSSVAEQAFTVEPETIVSGFQIPKHRTILSGFQIASAKATLKLECIDCL